jgi:glycosyltransferase involved in cell wall biosynthesis
MIEPSAHARVLHLLAPTREGGLEQVVTMMAAGQKGQGVHVAAVLPPRDADDHPFVRRLEALGVPVTRIIVGDRSYVREYRALNTLVERLKPQVLHTHGYRADLIGGIVARARQIPAVSTVHGFTGAGLRIRVNERVQCIILSRADAVIAVSLPLADRLARARVPRDKIHCVPNGLLPILSSVERAAARERLGIRTKGLIAGWVGRLSPEKGADVMIDALALVPPTWHLAVIGDGPQRDILRRRADRLGVSDRVSWHGSIPNAGSLLSAFDAFVLSSRTEGTPIALLEAMHASVPIVAACVGGVPDVLTSAHAILVPTEQPATIARALVQIEREPIAAKQRSVLARERLVRSFGSDEWLGAVDAIYRAASIRVARRG